MDAIPNLSCPKFPFIREVESVRYRASIFLTFEPWVEVMWLEASRK